MSEYNQHMRDAQRHSTNANIYAVIAGVMLVLIILVNLL